MAFNVQRGLDSMVEERCSGSELPGVGSEAKSVVVFEACRHRITRVPSS